MFKGVFKMAKKWIQKAVSPKTKGLLRKKLGAKKGENIPMEKLKKAKKSKSTKLKQEANFAINVRKSKKK
jgi:hypothetical protein